MEKKIVIGLTPRIIVEDGVEKYFVNICKSNGYREAKTYKFSRHKQFCRLQQKYFRKTAKKGGSPTGGDAAIFYCFFGVRVFFRLKTIALRDGR